MLTRRLDAWLSECGLGSRKTTRQLVRKKHVTVDGQLVTNAAQHVSDEQAICVDQQTIAPPRRSALHVLMHKPPGFACSDNIEEAPIISELLPAQWRDQGLHSAGRLDRDTSGLLLLTDDGQLLHRLIQPKRHVEKRYRITYTGQLRRDAVAACAEGLVLADDPKTCRPASLELTAPGEATLILHEGRFHQVKRMIAELGGEVIRLHRDRIGTLELPEDLMEGMVRECQADELARLQTSGA